MKKNSIYRYINTFILSMLKIYFQMTNVKEKLKTCKINNKKNTAQEH